MKNALATWASTHSNVAFFLEKMADVRPNHINRLDDYTCNDLIRMVTAGKCPTELLDPIADITGICPSKLCPHLFKKELSHG
ncbi:MAG: hypothetical protein RLY58_2247 [Pseudomonadota bacterium]|jgi:hypothetical protein